MVDRLGAVTAAAVAPATFLAVDPWGWYPFGPLRWLVVTVAVLAVGALVVGRRPLPRPARAPLVAGALLVGVMAVAAAGGLDPTYAWTGTPERHAGVGLWALALVALAVGAGIEPVRGAVVVGRGLVVAGLGVGVVGWAEAQGWEPDELDVGTRLTGTFGSSAFLGAACALLLPAVVGVAIDRGGSRGWRVAAGAAVVALAVPTVGSGARSAWLGLGAAGAVVLVGRRPTGRVRWRGPVVAAGALAIGLALVLSPAGARVADLGDADEPGGRGRLDEWRVATRVLADHPVLGVGPEGYRIAFADGVDERYEIRHGRDPLPDRAHSGPLDIALAGGAPALLAWGAWVVLVGRAAWRALRRGSPAVAGLAAALLAHLVGQLTLFPLAEVEPVAWLLAGVLLSTPVPRAGDQVPRAEGEPDRRLGRGAEVGVRAALGVLAVVALVVGALDVAADRRAADAARALADGDGAAAATAAEDAVALRPGVVRLRLLAARAEVAAGEGIVAALEQVDAGLRTSPGDPIALRERVRLLVARAAATEVPAHARRARAAADGAVAADPANAALWLLAGEAARLDRDPAAAEAAWSRAERLDPRSPAAAVDLALLHRAEGRDDEARDALDRARAIDPDDPRVREAARLVDG